MGCQGDCGKLEVHASFRAGESWDASVAQSVVHPTSAQVMISQIMGPSPTLGSVLTAQSLEPASDSVSPSLSAPPPLAHCLTLSLKYKYQFQNSNYPGKESKEKQLVRSTKAASTALQTNKQFLHLKIFINVLTAQSLEPASDSVSPSVSAPPLLMLCLSLSLKK